MTNTFAVDVEAIRQRARQEIDKGPVVSTNTADQERLLSILNEVVATEIVCWMRYQQHAIVAEGIHRGPVAAEFTEHAEEERQHALMVAERISALDGTPDLSPQGLSKSHTEYREFEDNDLVGMLKENLVAERIVIQSYQEIVRWIGDADPTTRRVIETILEQEEEHADDLRDLLGDLADDEPSDTASAAG